MQTQWQHKLIKRLKVITKEMTINRVTQPIIQWATKQEAILAAALVGSWARGTANAKSDVDLMFLSEQPLFFRENIDWLNNISWNSYSIDRWEDKDYGVVWSRHLQIISNDSDSCLEVEFSFGQKSWASITPLDPGTKRVIRDGCQILYDPDEIFAELARFVSAQKLNDDRKARVEDKSKDL
ncbi:MAG: nucleotidyltransferase domain-containing protein [Cyanobacteria bacterium J06643_4]